MYDIPAVINYILSQTGRSQLSYVGHSMGCTMFYVAMIKRPELNAKIDVMIGMGPATCLARMRSPVRYIVPFVTQIQVL